MSGNLNVAGNVVAGGTVTDSGCTLATHTHQYTWSHPSGTKKTEVGAG